MQLRKPDWARALREIKGNRRLQAGLAAVLLIVAGEATLRWSDRLGEQSRTLVRLRAETQTLRQQTRDEAALRQQLLDLGEITATVDERLWRAASEPLGQARLKDWLHGVLQRCSLASATLNLANSRPATATSPSRERGAPARPAAGAKDDGLGLREFRASIAFPFAPEPLECLLLELEGGEPYAAVDSLVVNKRERRVEVGARMLIDISPATLRQGGGAAS